jgi:hypothetical protein
LFAATEGGRALLAVEAVGDCSRRPKAIARCSRRPKVAADAGGGLLAAAGDGGGLLVRRRSSPEGGRALFRRLLSGGR